MVSESHRSLGLRATLRQKFFTGLGDFLYAIGWNKLFVVRTPPEVYGFLGELRSYGVDAWVVVWYALEKLMREEKPIFDKAWGIKRWYLDRMSELMRKYSEEQESSSQLQ